MPFRRLRPALQCFKASSRVLRILQSWRTFWEISSSIGTDRSGAAEARGDKKGRAKGNSRAVAKRNLSGAGVPYPPHGEYQRRGRHSLNCAFEGISDMWFAVFTADNRVAVNVAEYGTPTEAYDEGELLENSVYSTDEVGGVIRTITIEADQTGDLLFRFNMNIESNKKTALS